MKGSYIIVPICQYNRGDSMGYELDMEEVREESINRNGTRPKSTDEEEIERMVFVFGIV